MRCVNEERLVAAFVEGDQEAFDALLKPLETRIHEFFVRRFADEAVVDDLLGITLLKVHQARKEYCAGSPLSPWIFTIAAQVARNAGKPG